MGDMQLDPIIVGEVIAKFRNRKGLTQEVLSGLSDIGRTHLSAIERGERKPTLETLYRTYSKCRHSHLPSLLPRTRATGRKRTGKARMRVKGLSRRSSRGEDQESRSSSQTYSRSMTRAHTAMEAHSTMSGQFSRVMGFFWSEGGRGLSRTSRSSRAA